VRMRFRESRILLPLHLYPPLSGDKLPCAKSFIVRLAPSSNRQPSPKGPAARLLEVSLSGDPDNRGARHGSARVRKVHGGRCACAERSPQRSGAISDGAALDPPALTTPLSTDWHCHFKAQGLIPPLPPQKQHFHPLHSSTPVVSVESQKDRTKGRQGNLRA